MTKNAILIFTAMFLVLFSSTASAWDSVGYVTHEAVAYDAIHVLPQSEYPDLYMYEEDLKDGSESEKPHPDNKFNGGSVLNWWQGEKDVTNGGVSINYKIYSFKNAYLNIGRVAHLTQDQAVPAHAANIPHGPFNLHLDYFESYADQNYVSNPSNGYLNDSFPFDYYQPLQDLTRSNLSSWTKPSTCVPLPCEQYWVEAPSAPPLGQDATGGDRSGGEAPWGSYGGSSGPHDDIYLDLFLQVESPEISNDQIYEATHATAGVFAAASRKLPALTRNLNIDSSAETAPVIDPINGSLISFEILENRKQNVTVFITVDDQYGTGIIDSTGRNNTDSRRTYIIRPHT